MAIVFIPSLVALLESKENEAGYELTQSEVESIRDNATTVELPSDIVDDMDKSRGYQDLNASNVWNDWLIYKKTRWLWKQWKYYELSLLRLLME
nr:hypothetical protein [Providencia alcalifaciens]